MSIFLEFFRTSLFRSKKHSFLSRISINVFFFLFLLRKKIWGKGRFFDKNHRLTTLQNADFFRLCENFTFEVQKNFIFYPEYQKMFLSSHFAHKKSDKNKVDFETKTMDKRTCKISIFLTLLELNFSGVKSILYFPEYKKLFLSGFVC